MFTCEGFLYPILNRTLRLANADAIIRMGFLIDDLYRHIEKLHNEHHADSAFSLSRSKFIQN
jgi:hypothetical protein